MARFASDFEETRFEEWQWGKTRSTPPEPVTRQLPRWAQLARIGLEIELLVATIWLQLLPVYLLMSYVTAALLVDYLPRIRFYGFRRVLRRFNIRPPTRSDVLIAACGCVLLVTAQSGLSALFSLFGVAPSDHVIATDSINIAVYVLYLSIFLVAVPAEEIIFRENVQRHLLGGRRRGIRVGLTSLLFGVMHLPVYGLSLSAAASIAVICIVSTVFGYCYELSRNLLVPITVHLFMNSVAISLLFFASL